MLKSTLQLPSDLARKISSQKRKRAAKKSQQKWAIIMNVSKMKSEEKTQNKIK